MSLCNSAYSDSKGTKKNCFFFTEIRISILWQVQKFAWLSPGWVKAIDICVLWPTYSWDLVVDILCQIRVGWKYFTICFINIIYNIFHKYFNPFPPLRRMEWRTLVVDKDKRFKFFKLSTSCSKVSTGESTWLCFVLILKRDSTQIWINNLAKLLFFFCL